MAVRWVSARSQTFFEGEGSERRAVRTIGAVLDVTERKRVSGGAGAAGGGADGQAAGVGGGAGAFLLHDHARYAGAAAGDAGVCGDDGRGVRRVARRRRRRGFLQRIRTSASRMDALITDALNYSRTVRQELALEPVDAGALLRGMLDSYPELQPSKARIEMEGEIPLVMGNEAGLTQCFSNLLGNAVKFVKPGEKPEIRIWAEVVQRPGCWAKPGVGRRDAQPGTLDGGCGFGWRTRALGYRKTMLPRVFDMFSPGSGLRGDGHRAGAGAEGGAADGGQGGGGVGGGQREPVLDWNCRRRG